MTTETGDRSLQIIRPDRELESRTEPAPVIGGIEHRSRPTCECFDLSRWDRC